jgi:predicted SnoaL-like aldol condensation-catalyzing enzyme
LQEFEGYRPKELFKPKEKWKKYTIIRKDVLHPFQEEVIENMRRCQEAGKDGLGYHKYACPNHPDKVRIVPHTCKTKICSTCAAIRNDMWGEEIKQRLPKGKYFHITFTMPEEFRTFFHKEWNHDWAHMNNLYILAWQVLRGYYKSQHKIFTGAVIVLHTFGRDLKINPHLHCIVPAGGLDETKNFKKWKKLEYLAHEYLTKAWKHNLLEYVMKNIPYFQKNVKDILKWAESNTTEGKKKVINYINTFAPPEEREKWEKVTSIDYYVHTAQRNNFKNTVSYIARYSRRLPISKSRIVDFDQEKDLVTWAYQPHNKGEQEVLCTIKLFEFYDRIIRHIAPKHFRLVRYYGIFAAKNKKRFDKILHEVCEYEKPEPVLSWRERIFAYEGKDPLICPCCQTELELVEKAVWDFKHEQLNIQKIVKK